MPLITSLQIVASIVNNRLVGDVIEEAMEKIQKGKSMSSALESSPWFPPMFIQMVGVGEQSGQLESMLDKVAKTYEREVETAILGMTSLIEPIMIDPYWIISRFRYQSKQVRLFQRAIPWFEKHRPGRQDSSV